MSCKWWSGVSNQPLVNRSMNTNKIWIHKNKIKITCTSVGMHSGDTLNYWYLDNAVPKNGGIQLKKINKNSVFNYSPSCHSNCVLWKILQFKSLIIHTHKNLPTQLQFACSREKSCVIYKSFFWVRSCQELFGSGSKNWSARFDHESDAMI